VKKQLVVASLSAWVSNVMPNPGLRLGKKTPWYRSTRLRNVPWLAVAFIAPFAIFLGWKGVTLLLRKGERGAQSSGNQPPATELT
jgi:hypothetical protein